MPNTLHFNRTPYPQLAKHPKSAGWSARRERWRQQGRDRGAENSGVERRTTVGNRGYWWRREGQRARSVGLGRRRRRQHNREKRERTERDGEGEERTREGQVDEEGDGQERPTGRRGRD
ncbi:hypothetical protein I3760_06G054000 [Carya illinoinensis]|nr:hypothetical protein I3760_06G054000 [Carya illinoinensis]